MAYRPQCSRVGMTFWKESAYGTQVLVANVTKLFEPLEPLLLNVTQERFDDAAMLKGHEWPLVAASDVLIAQDISIPFSFPSSLNVIGLLSAFALGASAVTGTTPDFTHTQKVVDACTSDQLASTTWYLGLMGAATSIYVAKGIIINELRISMNTVGRLEVTGTALSDGTLTAAPAYTFPTTTSHADYIYGTHGDFKSCVFGGSPVSYKSTFRGFDFTINNNLDVADGRSNIASAATSLPSLRFGERGIGLVVRVEGHPASDNVHWAAYLAGTLLDVNVIMTNTAARLLDIRLKSVKIASITPSFDGIRDVLEITYKPFYTVADLSPVVVIVKNGDAAYLVAA